MSGFGIFRGRNVRGRNVQAKTSLAEMSMAEMSEHHKPHTTHPVLCTHLGFNKGILTVSCYYPTPVRIK